MPVQPDPEATACECSGYSIEPGWSTEEFAGVDLQDQRLNKRLLLVSAQFAAQPQAQINQACEDWASAKGAYRLFENGKVNAERILAPHQQRTCARMAGHSLVLAIQDTTYFNYRHHPATQGLGLVGSVEDGHVGVIMPTTLALTLQGVPLGVLTQERWAREEPEFDPVEQRKQRRQSPIEAKESYKWVKAIRQTLVLCPEGVEVVTVGDSETDLYEIFQEAEDLEAKLLVRASQDRAVVCSGRLRQVLARRPVAGHLKVEIPAPAQRKQAARTAHVELRYGRVRLRPPYRPMQGELTPASGGGGVGAGSGPAC